MNLKSNVGLSGKIANYHLVRTLGQGGMGAVFEAVHDQTGARVAIKVLKPDAQQNPDLIPRLLAEARVLAQMQHPGVVALYDVGVLADQQLYMIMERLNGETLSTRLRRLGGSLPTGMALRIARQLALTLSEVHAKGIIHRDLKPDNIFLVPDPEAADGERAKLIDFGIAKRPSARSGASEEELTEPWTRAGQIVGTPLYMAPEQCRGDRSIGPKADVYSLGIILFRLSAGRLPFFSDSTAEVFAMQLRSIPPPLDLLVQGLPVGMSALVKQMLAKEAEERPSMDAARHQLAGFELQQRHGTEGSSIASELLRPLSPPVATWLRRPAVAAVAMCLLLGSVGGGLALVRYAMQRAARLASAVPVEVRPPVSAAPGLAVPRSPPPPQQPAGKAALPPGSGQRNDRAAGTHARSKRASERSNSLSLNPRSRHRSPPTEQPSPEEVERAAESIDLSR